MPITVGDSLPQISQSLAANVPETIVIFSVDIKETIVIISHANIRWQQARITMDYQIIKQLLVLAKITVGKIAEVTEYKHGDVSVCLKQSRPYKPLRLLIEDFFESEFKRLILARSFNQKELELLLVLLDLTADDLAELAECPSVRINAWMVGGPVSSKTLEKIAIAVSGLIKEKLFDSSLEAATV